MSMRDRHITFGSTDLMAEFPLYYSDFEETEPEPKTNKVVIPAGTDKDITEALGPVAFSNGTHTFKLLMHSQSLEDELRRFKALVHGQRSAYALSWDEGYSYVGRWKVAETDYLTEEAALLTVSVDRYPWRVRSDGATFTPHPSETYVLEGSARFGELTLKLGQAGTVSIDGGTPVEYAAGTHVIPGEFEEGTEITVTFSTWYYYVDGTNLVVNPDYYTASGTDVTFDDPPFSVVGTDIHCADSASQLVELDFTRRDF